MNNHKSDNLPRRMKVNCHFYLTLKSSRLTL